MALKLPPRRNRHGLIRKAFRGLPWDGFYDSTRGVDAAVRCSDPSRLMLCYARFRALADIIRYRYSMVQETRGQGC